MTSLRRRTNANRRLSWHPRAGSWWQGLIVPAHWWSALDGAVDGVLLRDRIGSATWVTHSGTPTYSADGWSTGIPTIDHGTSNVVSRAPTTIGNGTIAPYTISVAISGAVTSSGRPINIGNTAARQFHGLFNTGTPTIRIDRNVTTQFNNIDTTVASTANRLVISWSFNASRQVYCYVNGTRRINGTAHASTTGDVVVNALMVGGWIRDGSSVVSPCACNFADGILASGALSDAGLALLHAAHLAAYPVA